MPQISVIVPVYNCAPYLKKSLQGICRQTLEDFELILVDDGSTDSGGAICDRFAELDDRVRVIHQPNSGAGVARNTGMQTATAPYLFFPDADDEMEPDMLQLLWDAAERSKADIVVCGFTEAYDNPRDGTMKTTVLPAAEYGTRQQVRTFFASWYPDGTAGYLWNKLYRAAPLHKGNAAFPSMRRYQDGMFNMHAFDLAERVCVIENCLYHYKLNSVADNYAKFPRNKLELMCRLVESYQQVVAQWDIDQSVPEKRIRSFLLRGAVSCIDCLNNPAWKMDSQGKRAYLQEVASNPLIARELPQRESYSRYVDLILGLLAACKFGRIRTIVFWKIRIKQHVKPLFRMLKSEG